MCTPSNVCSAPLSYPYLFGIRCIITFPHTCFPRVSSSIFSCNSAPGGLAPLTWPKVGKCACKCAPSIVQVQLMPTIRNAMLSERRKYIIPFIVIVVSVAGIRWGLLEICNHFANNKSGWFQTSWLIPQLRAALRSSEAQVHPSPVYKFHGTGSKTRTRQTPTHTHLCVQGHYNRNYIRKPWLRHGEVKW
jgi:hypothetical protein